MKQTSKEGRIHVVLNPKEKPVLAADWPDQPEHSLLRSIEQEMEALIGLSGLKTLIRELYASAYISKKRTEAGIETKGHMLHMLFTGNPGTGKTTAARLIASMFKRLGLLEKGQFIEAERADLVGEYIGHTAQKTRDLVKKALGGVLFIDEAYSLARGGEKDFGKEAIDTLVKQMEDHQNSFILILAGYPREMAHFLSMNPGLQSRFPLIHHFPDYSVDELLQIADVIAAEKKYEIDHDSRHILTAIIEQEKRLSGFRFANGRNIRTLIEKAARRQAVRLMAQSVHSKKELKMLKGEDFQLSQ
ncbi:AAA family ATPase [Domibacillus iocasae]|uniref:Stage V sporulation protein K n=1 Tax=Domibacillus iocasae TaxID=1714016 RepID=A0A1E7DKB3_9BACI|nr:AAA family ATPase [Domibacillus iocasae]OES43526.1 stage V sporulation protein K [Domibacillus iocasae]